MSNSTNSMRSIVEKYRNVQSRKKKLSSELKTLIDVIIVDIGNLLDVEKDHIIAHNDDGIYTSWSEEEQKFYFNDDSVLNLRIEIAYDIDISAHIKLKIKPTAMEETYNIEFDGNIYYISMKKIEDKSFGGLIHKDIDKNLYKAFSRALSECAGSLIPKTNSDPVYFVDNHK